MKKLDHTQESFDALIDLLVENGNQVAGKRWNFTREGFFTVLRDPIDWSLVYASFSIDPNAVMVYEHSIATYGGMYELGYQRLK